MEVPSSAIANNVISVANANRETENPHTMKEAVMILALCLLIEFLKK